MEPRHLTMPVVSVVIAVYNGERFLRDALNSLFAQSFQDFEVICVDNGSSDDSLNVIEDVAQSTREIRVIRHAPRGQSEARNAGAAQARGRYIAFLDQDDVWYTDKLLHQVRVLEERSDVVLVHSDVDFIEDAGKVTKRRVTSKARRTASRSPLAQLIGMELCFILPSALLVRKAAFEAVGGFDPALIRGEDYDLCWRLAPQGRFEFIDSPAVGYRFHAGNFSQSVGGASFNGDEGYKSGERFYLKLLDHYSSDSHKRMLARRLLAECYSGWGKYKVNVGVRRGGRTLLLRSLRYNPWRFRTYSRILRSYLPLWVGR